MSDLTETTAPRLSAQWEIDKVCDEFENGVRRGECPRIEDFLERVSEAHRAVLLRELVRIELEYRRKRGETPQEGEYLSRFPKYWDALADLFIPGYELLGELGRGGMGVVYRARHLALDCEVALKVMRSGLFASADELHRFRFEAQAVQELNHPAIVRLLGLGDAHGRPFLCLAYLEGGSLAERLRSQGPLPYEEAARLLLQVTRAMQHAHERGILHRDLKPANILLDKEGSPHVADFGLARRAEGGPAVTHTGAIVGTPSYMAPEQGRGESATTASDIWALGAILYELLTGAPPFRGETVAQTLQMLQDRPIARLRDARRSVPVDLEAICLKCLEKESAHRYASCRELAGDLAAYLAGEPISVHPPGIWDWLGRAVRTRPQPAPEYTWSAPFYAAALVFGQHATVTVLLRTKAPSLAIPAVLLAGWVGSAFVLWYVLLCRFRQIPVTERHSSLVAIGHMLAQIILYLCVGPLLPGESLQAVLALYPPITVVTGLCFVVLGSTNWGRLLPVGVALMALAPIMAAWPGLGPPLYALACPAALILWGLGKWRYFVGTGEKAKEAVEQGSKKGLA